MNLRLFSFGCFCVCALANLLGMAGVTVTVFPVLGGYAAMQVAPIFTAYCVLVIYVAAPAGLLSWFLSAVTED
ncbi:hypothetical protein [Beijerinckia sp. L45]|uniref:hypothetical protein n=1 Tax=Beijerinckia sp. L45 TaxID=1641855 RepID=UPI00131C7A71|nr:hypothetical protein [Beijerinckia sp. L45]